MKDQESELLKRITIIPGLMGGKPTIRGNRFEQNARQRNL
jgi:uncharacterized protein (DUF433 family)